MPEGTISALRLQEHDRQRVNVFIDGSFALGVSLETLTREQLYVGKQIDAQQWARLAAAESVSKALHAALRWLQARPRSIAEIRERLQRKQFAPETIEAVIARLTDLDMLDDAAFARYWVESRNRSRPRGQQALRSELARKGIDRETVAQTLRDEELVGDEHERARALARDVLPKYAQVADRATFQRRLGGYLQRRGFAYALIKPIVDELWREVGSGTPEP